MKNLDFFPFSPVKNKKPFVCMGIIVGILTLGSGIYMNVRAAFPMYRSVLAALAACLYLSLIPNAMNVSARLIRPFFTLFDKLCVKHRMDYQIVMHSRSIGIKFAEATPLTDRFKFGLFFNLILLLQVFTLMAVFGVMILVLFLLANLMS